MSSRALRKLQREQELQRQIEVAKKAYEEAEESEEEGEEDLLPTINRPVNAFDMLEDAEDNEGDSEEDMPASEVAAPTVTAEPQNPPSSSSKSRKKKKKGKGKSKPKDKNVGSTTQQYESEDEVDRALKELAVKDARGITAAEDETTTWEARATNLLAVEEKNLNPVNEMKSLFGSIALETQDSRASSRQQRQRDQNLQGGVDLATALTGRHCVGSRGRELGALAHRRNIFVQGREEWPLATSGGLSMEYVKSKTTSFEKTYNIMHNTLYQETQLQFHVAVESMDPQQMIGLLSMHPYHIATLLQVSEIAKHQGDHAVSGDLLERALFSFGKSVHSSFPASLRTGVARMPFDKPANRELYLAIWRYIKNLEMRGTWRTAFEWTKILLQLNPITDPYGVTLMIDQLALRGRQHAQLIEICSDDAYGQAWDFLANIQISLSLAYLRSGRPQEARRQLAIAMHKYPYILSALASALDITPLPKSLWAKLPSTDAEKLHTQLYVTRAKDLWNTPETISLLAEVAETLPHYNDAISAAAPAPKLEISLEEARHIMLLEIPSLISLLPRAFTSRPTSSYDVLAPPTSDSHGLVMRAPAVAAASQGAEVARQLFHALGITADFSEGLLTRVLQWFQTPAGPEEFTGITDGMAALQELQQEGLPPELVQQVLQRSFDALGGRSDGLVTPAGLGMAGGWDYYQDADQDNSEVYEEDEDSMPDLESLSDDDEPSQPAPVSRNPRAAMVEEDEDENEDRPSQPNHQLAGGAVLRHVDSDSDSEDVASRSARLQPAPTPPSASAGAGSTTDLPGSTSDGSDFTDPQRLQRWLITSGLTDLQSNPETLGLYVSRLKTLPRKAQQDWVVSMVRQRAGADVEGRVKAALL
ncbi:hypothetical protein RBB50_010978 [Rhinocladiella similis]